MRDDLAGLIASHKGDRSYDELARDGGGTPTRKRWQQLATQPLANYPDPPTIRAMARALGVSVSTVVASCSQTLGLEVLAGVQGGVDLDGLTPRQAEAVRAVIRAMREPGGTTDGTPMTPPISRPLTVVNDMVGEEEETTVEAHGSAGSTLEPTQSDQGSEKA